jgi:hypothetical protein
VNVIGIFATMIAGSLYANVGIKILYQNLDKDLLKGPELTEKRGKLICAAMDPIYWYNLTFDPLPHESD